MKYLDLIPCKYYTSLLLKETQTAGHRIFKCRFINEINKNKYTNIWPYPKSILNNIVVIF